MIYMNEEFIAVGKRVEEIRLSQPGKPNKKDFAKMIKMPHQNLGQVERGEIGLSRDNLISICKITGASADYILFGKNINLINVLKNSLGNYTDEQIEVALEVFESLFKLNKKAKQEQ